MKRGTAQRRMLDALMVFVCVICRRDVPWDKGAADDMPEACDACWWRAHRKAPR